MARSTDHDSAHAPTAGELSAERAGADTADLRAGLADLASLVTGSAGLPEILAQVATFAVRAIPGADGAGVTLLRMDRPGDLVEARAASAPFVTEIDALQYDVLGEGPCITAARERRTVRSGSLGGEKLWPRFGPRVGRLGVHSVLSLPLTLPTHTVGAITVYAHAKNVFDARAAGLGELFAAAAAVSVHNAQVLAQALALIEQLQSVIVSRPVIDQAVGIMRARSGNTTEQSMDRMRALSHSGHVKLSVVAQQVVDEAVRRAQARQSRRLPEDSAPTPAHH